jgi:hypothetical protein
VVVLVLLDYGSLCSFLSFFSFSLVVAGKHSIEALEGVSLPVIGGIAWLYFSFYQSLRPDLCCFAALSSTRAPSLARRRPLVLPMPPSAGKLIGDRRVVITRQGVLHILSRS